MTINIIETIKGIVEKFFEKLDIPISKLDVLNEENNIYLLKIETNESGILIGPHGKNLEAIEAILKLMLSNLLVEKIKLNIEINDYIHSKEEKLLKYIKTKIEYVKQANKDIKLPFLTAYERKKVHSYVAELQTSNIYTKSIGEGQDRRLFICKKDEKITIDLDGDDI